MKLFSNALCVASCSIFVAACGGGGGGGGGGGDGGNTSDTTAPNTSISSAPADPTNSTSASFVFASTEAGSTFQCSLDGGALANCISPDDYAGLAEGNHTFSVQATDAAGNTDSTPATHDWEIDLTSPDTSITSGPADPTNSTSASFVFASTEPGSTFQCSLDGSGDFSATGTAIGSETDRTFDIALGDIDGDGYLDVVGGQWLDINKFHLNDGNGGFSVTGTTIGSATDGTLSVDLGDVDGDGDLDLVVGNGSQINRLHLNDGSGGFSATGIAIGSETDPTFSVVLGDIDGDGDLDLVVGNSTTSNKLYLNDGSGGFSATGIAIGSETDDTRAIALGDIDGDGDLDVVASNSAQTNKLYLNDGSGGFSATGIAIGSEIDSTEAVTLGDIDGDGDLDLVAGNYGQTNKLYLNDGSGGFSATGIAIGSEADRTFSIALGDIDGDGDIDLVVGNDIQINRLYINDGSGGFSATGIPIGSETEPTDAVVLGDIDGDGDLDLVTGNDGLQPNKLYLNSGTAFTDCSSPVNYSALAEGNHAFSVQATDAAGNTDATPATYNWQIDVTPPETSISSGPADPTNSTSASFVFTSTEAGSTFQCSLDGAALSNCSSPNNYAGLAEGNHTFSVEATDAAGNTDSTPATHDWEIDITPPDTSISGAPASPTNLTSASFVFISTEAGSTFQCSLDGAALFNCNSPVDYVGLAEGNHTFSVEATDAAENTDSTPAIHNWTIDLTPPVVLVPLGITVVAADASGAPATNPAIQAFLNGATATDNVDGDVTSSISNDAPATFPIGITTVTFSATDTVGNTGSNSSAVEVIVTDIDAPDTTSIVINNNALYAVFVSEFTARLIALDNVGVTDYLITEHNATDPANIVPPYLDPLSSDGRWVAVAETAIFDNTIQFPLAQTYSLGDTVDLCAWFMDAQNNISARVCNSIIYGVDWESGIGNWFADNGVWQVGTPTAGPTACNTGTQCAGTNLAGDYPVDTDSRLVSTPIILPTLVGLEESHLRFQNWYSYAGGDGGQVQVQVWDAATSTWGAWSDVQSVINNIANMRLIGNTSEWSLVDVDLTDFAGETIRVGFYHFASRPGCCDPADFESTGWYIDDVEIVTKVPAFTGSFESGWDDWGTENGIWQVGTPTAGPSACNTGTQCAGTNLAGDYSPDTDGILKSASVTMPDVTGFEQIHLRFQHWFSYLGGDSGQVQVQVWNAATSTWGPWMNEGVAVVNASGWSVKDVDLTAYAGELVRIGFFHSASRPGCCDPADFESTGWYIDDVSITVF